MFLCAGALFSGIWTAAVHVNKGAAMEHCARYLDSHVNPGDHIFGYRLYPQTLPVYLHKTIGVAAFQGELAFGVSLLPAKIRKELFPNAKEFAALWKSQSRIYCVTDGVSIGHLSKDHIAPVYTLLHEGKAYILSNHPAKRENPSPPVDRRTNARQPGDQRRRRG